MKDCFVPHNDGEIANSASENYTTASLRSRKLSELKQSTKSELELNKRLLRTSR